jgi:uncharacterized damage-inducible protein DinB
MDEKALFLKFWKREAVATRKVISRIPQDKSGYRPEPRSRNAREIAWVIVREDLVLGDGLEKGSFDWTERPTPGTVQEILDLYDARHDAAAAKIEALSADRWNATLPFIMDGKEVMSAPGSEMAWGILFDIIHHRGQLTTYLRPMGSTVPAIYGPSADES